MDRLKVFKLIIIGAFVFLIGSLGWVQILNGSVYFKKSENNRIRTIPIPAPRGYILDRKGDVIVDNRASFELSVIPEEIRDHPEAIGLLAELLKDEGISRELIEEKIRGGRRAPFVSVSIIKDLSFSNIARVEENNLDLPGVFITPSPIREYRHKLMASHLLGYVGKISPVEYERLSHKGYRRNDLIGKSGVEKIYDEILKGSPGSRYVEITAAGRHVETLKEIDAVAGSNISLSIDSEIQRIVEDNFGPYRGACIVIASDTGEILAMVSKPGFDPNDMAVPTDNKMITQYFSDNEKPLINRCIQSAYSPGSVFKIVLAIAALEEKKISRETAFFCDGKFPVGSRNFHCMGHHGSISLVEAIERSCNVYFYNLGMLLGPEGMADYARRLGLGSTTGIDLPYEKKGIVPSREWKKKNVLSDGRWYKGETAVFAIGQGFLQVTPLQMLYAANAIVNGGKLFQPSLISVVHGSRTVKAKKNIPEYTELNFRPDHLELIKQGMFRVVHGNRGTARKVRDPEFEVGGKTGTVQVKGRRGYKRDHGWFFGFSPIEEPKYSLIVFVENQGYGSGKPASLAKTIFKKINQRERYEKYFTQKN